MADKCNDQHCLFCKPIDNFHSLLEHCQLFGDRKSSLFYDKNLSENIPLDSKILRRLAILGEADQNDTKPYSTEVSNMFLSKNTSLPHDSSFNITKQSTTLQATSGQYGIRKQPFPDETSGVPLQQGEVEQQLKRIKTNSVPRVWQPMFLPMTTYYPPVQSRTPSAFSLPSTENLAPKPPSFDVMRPTLQHATPPLLRPMMPQRCTIHPGCTLHPACTPNGQLRTPPEIVNVHQPHDRSGQNIFRQRPPPAFQNLAPNIPAGYPVTPVTSMSTLPTHIFQGYGHQPLHSYQPPAQSFNSSLYTHNPQNFTGPCGYQYLYTMNNMYGVDTYGVRSYYYPRC